jgi:DNA ligase (NAD+)
MSIDFTAINTDPYNYAIKLTPANLVKLLKSLSTSYYTENPVITDNVYDILKSVLEEKDPKNKFLKTVGYDMTNDRTKVKLPYPLFSLDKLKTITLWLNKYSGPYMLSDKLDGISGLLFKDGKVVKLFTRGDGINGQDISHLLPYVLKKFNYDILPEKCAIRGELVISKKNYETVKTKYLDHRSCISGLVNSKKDALLKEKDKEELAQLTDLVFYELIHPRHKTDTQFKMMSEWKLPLVHHKLRQDISNESLSEYLTERRQASDYYIDGIVNNDCSKVYELKIDGNPDYAFAFKLVFSDQIFETVIRSIEWNVSKDGYIKPVAILDPVNINGITVSRVTGNNAQYVVSNKIGPGTVIKIIRSGDVIPKIIEVVSGQVDKPPMPLIKYKWNDTGKDLIAIETSNLTKNTMVTKKITYFFESMGTQFMGEGIVKKLVLAGYDSIEKILKANIKELSKIDGLGEGVLTKIFESIRVSFETATLSTLMASAGVFGRSLGKKKIDIITNAIPTIMTEKNDENLREKINNLNGFSNITTNQFINGLDKFKEFYNVLLKIDTISVGHMSNIKTDTKKDDTKQIFSNMKFAITGTRNKENKEFIESNGGKIQDAVNKTTNMLLYESNDDSSSNKYINAVKFGITMMTNKEFKEKYIQ